MIRVLARQVALYAASLGAAAGGVAAAGLGSPRLALAAVACGGLAYLLRPRGASARVEARYPGNPADTLERAVRLLERRGFELTWRSRGRARLTRGKSWDINSETEWAGVSQVVALGASPAGDGCLLSARCALGAWAAMQPELLDGSEAVRETAAAAARLDEPGLERLDRERLSAPADKALRVGAGAAASGGAAPRSARIGGTLNRMLLPVGAAAILGMAAMLLFAYFLERGAEDVMARVELARRIDAVETVVLPRERPLVEGYAREFRDLLAGPKGLPLPEALRALRAAEPLQPLFVAVMDGNRLRALPGADPFHLPATTLGDDFNRPGFFFGWEPQGKVEGVMLGPLASRGVVAAPPIRLVVGLVVPTRWTLYALPHFEDRMEVTIWRASAAAARYRYAADGKASYARDPAALPADVAAEAARPPRESAWRLLESAARPSAAVPVLLPGGVWREEVRGGEEWTVLYELRPAAAKGRFDGASIAVPSSELAEMAEVVPFRLLTAGLFLGASLVIIPFLLLFQLTLLWWGARLAGPLLRLRDALEAMAGGDSSIRLEAERSDEVGQLERAANRLAERLAAREPLRDVLGRRLALQARARALEAGFPADGGTTGEASVLRVEVGGLAGRAGPRARRRDARSADGLLGRLADLIGVHGGALDESLGDGLVAVFTSIPDHPHHARRAVIAALEAQVAIRMSDLAAPEAGREEADSALGVVSGEGSPEGLSALRNAARELCRQERVPLSELIVDDATRRSLGESFVFDELRGIPAAWRVAGISPSR